MLKSLITGLCLSFFLLPVFAEPLIFSAPPRETVEKGNTDYKPLATYLTDLLGKPVEYRHPGNWLNYQRDMRADKYDIVFDGPHFVAWRIAHLDNHVLVKLPGKLQFHLIISKNDPDIKTLDDLIGKRICGISPPNLSTLSVLAAFGNPVRQPIIRGIKGGMGKVYKAFKAGRCPAAVLRTTFYNKKLTDAERQQLSILYTSEPLTNQGITVSRRISQSEQGKILQGLLSTAAGKAALQPILKRFGGKAKAFLPAKDAEYEGANMLLEGVIFGW